MADAVARCDLINAFAGRMIDRADHPALLRLIGAKQSCRERKFRPRSSSATSNMRSPTAICPNVLCMVAYVLDANLRHVRTIRMWRGEFGSTPPFDIGPDTLFVAYSRLGGNDVLHGVGLAISRHIFDLHTAYLAASNILLPHDPDEVRKKQRKRLSDACRAYGIEGWEQIDKETIAQGHRRRPLARLRPRSRLTIIARKTCARRHSCCARNCAGSRRFDRRQRRARAALVELQRQGDRADPGARHADRHALVESGAGEQGRRHRRICCGNSIPATAATTRSTRRKASGATRGSSVG